MSIIDWVDGSTPVNAENLDKLEQIARKGVPLGYPPLDESGLIPVQHLPPTGEPTTLGEWTYNATITAPPATGQVRINNAAWAAATVVWLAEQTAGDVDVASLLAGVKAGQELYLQEKDNAENWVRYSVTANAVDQGTYAEVAVAFLDGGGAPPTPAQRVVVTQRKHPGAAGGGGVEYENDWAAGITYQAGDVVRYNGVDYLAVNPSTGQVPPAALPASIPLVTVLPASPVDGQEVILTDSLTVPTYAWRFRYNAGSTSAYKWEFVGGVRKLVSVAGAEALPWGGSAGAWADAATVGPSFVAPRAGMYDVHVGTTFLNDGAAPTVQSFLQAGIGIGAFAVAAVAAITSFQIALANAYVSAFAEGSLEAAAGQEIRVRYTKVTNNPCQVLSRFLLVAPVRVS